MTPDRVGFALLLLGVLLYAGKWLRLHWRFAQTLFLPGSILAGLIGLVVGPHALGAFLATGDGVFAEGPVPPWIYQVWGSLPGLLISVVFATLLMGVPLPAPRRVWRLAGPQLAFGLSLGAGQYVVGILLVALFLAPVFGLPMMAGALIEIGFEGGHGTAAGLQAVFADLGYPEGGDLAVGMATVGVIAGIVVGIVLVNWGARSGRTACLDGRVQGLSRDQRRGVVGKEGAPRTLGAMTVRPESMEPLTLHLAMIAIAILIGLGLLEGMSWLERATWGGDGELVLLGAVPLFPMAMLGGVIVQALLGRLGLTDLLDRETMVRLQGLALDVLIAAAIASLSLPVIADNLVPFLTLAGAGILWCLFLFLWAAPRMIPDYWFERAIGDFGQSMGVTATGLILMKIADPENRSPAYEAFGYKQLLFEPFFGGGLITGISVPLIYNFGPWPLFVAMVMLLVLGLGSGLLYFGRLGRQNHF